MSVLQPKAMPRAALVEPSIELPAVFKTFATVSLGADFTFPPSRPYGVAMNSPSPWYLNPLFLTPIFGLAGAVIGGLITFLSPYFIESKRIERERLREECEHSAALRQAARLVQVDLANVAATLNAAVEAGKLWPNPKSTSIPSWDICRSILARELSGDTWKEVSLAIITVDTVQQAYQTWTNTNPMNDAQKAFLKDLISEIESGRDALRPFSA